jgi:hypothetical protein
MVSGSRPVSPVIESQALGSADGLAGRNAGGGDRRRCEGWAVDNIPRNCAFFFCDRQNERVCVSIECYETDASSSTG